MTAEDERFHRSVGGGHAEAGLVALGRELDATRAALGAAREEHDERIDELARVTLECDRLRARVAEVEAARDRAAYVGGGIAADLIRAESALAALRAEHERLVEAADAALRTMDAADMDEHDAECEWTPLERVCTCGVDSFAALRAALPATEKP